MNSDNIPLRLLVLKEGPHFFEPVIFRTMSLRERIIARYEQSELSIVTKSKTISKEEKKLFLSVRKLKNQFRKLTAHKPLKIKSK